MTRFWQQSRLLLWKCGLLKRRHYLATTFEMVLMLLLFVLIAVVQWKTSKNSINIDNPTYYSTFNSFNLMEELMFDLEYSNGGGCIYFAPNGEKNQELIDLMLILTGLSPENATGFPDESALELQTKIDDEENPQLDRFAIILNNNENFTDEWPKTLSYVIRPTANLLNWYTDKLFPALIPQNPPDYYHQYFSGFLSLQLALDNAFMHMIAGKSGIANLTSVRYSLEPFPYPPYHKTSPVLSSIYGSICLCFILSVCILIATLIRRVITEKETGIKALMKMNGLQSWMLWTGWYIYAMISATIIIPVIIILLMVPLSSEAEALYRFSNWFLIWVFLNLGILAGISFACFFSTFFSRPAIGISVINITWIISYVIPNYFSANVGFTVGWKIFAALMPALAINWGLKGINFLEQEQIGLQWDTLFDFKAERGSNFSSENMVTVGVSALMLIVDIVLFNVLLWYMDHIKPGPYEISKPWNFMFQVFSCKTPPRSNVFTLQRHISHIEKYVEEPNEGMAVGISIRDLYKSFGNTDAVKGLSMNIYRDQITALLGHNGAGKTTTMSILTGMYSKTSGEVEINGYNVDTNRNDIKDMVGLCPQHNLHFSDLTVLEHLYFFARLKGLSLDEAKRKSDEVLELLNLTNKKDALSKELSGGMKRKLSLGMALVGEASVLLLDEPTSGLDPEARRELWDFILSLRTNRTIVITTHIMEEADVLGDRIAILDHGQLQCYGTSMFLKKQFGTGYHLSLIKSDGTSVKTVTNIVQTHVPEAVLEENSTALLSFILPLDDSAKFPKLFHTLEMEKDALQINSIGLSITTLEEVFLEVGKLNAEELMTEASDTTLEGKKTIYKKSSGLKLEFNRFKALLYKKNLFSLRKYFLYAVMAVLPIVLTAIVVILEKVSPQIIPDTDTTLNLNIKQYEINGPTEIYYTTNDHKNPTELANAYQELYGATVVDDFNKKILSIASNSMQEYSVGVVAGADFNVSTSFPFITKARGRFSIIAYHAAPISLNMISNTLCRYFLGQEYSINASIHTLKKKQNLVDLLNNAAVAGLWNTCIPLGLIFVMGLFMNFPIVERSSNTKHVQIMTGTSSFIYWLSVILWDFIYYLIIMFLMVAIIAIFDTDHIFSNPAEMSVLITVLILYGLSGILFSYIFSFGFQTFASAFGLNIIAVGILGLILQRFVTTMEYFKKFQTAGHVLKYIAALVMPHFSLCYSLFKFPMTVVKFQSCLSRSPTVFHQLCNTDINKNASDVFCCEFDCGGPNGCQTPNYFDVDTGIGVPTILMAVNIVCFITVLALIEMQVPKMLWQMLWEKIYRVEIDTKLTDLDVIKEHERVEQCINGQSPRRENIILVDNLQKKYKGKFIAVRGISFGVNIGECFGLLGVNGAGKTTTFQMLTGSEIPSNGDADINHFKLKKDKKMFLSQIGYCPQFDPINEVLTGREMLTLFSHLRGIPVDHLEDEVQYWIALLGLNEYADKPSGVYSGGNKRKLSTAMALIGDPPLVMLDEPTSGVDPISRRKLWEVLGQIQKSGQSVIFTSHSMEECEALCHRLAIMVNGQLMCIGSTQYLKHRFGQGFTLMLKLRTSETIDLQILKRKIEECYRCVLKDEHLGFLHYHITDSNTTWYELFENMENIKAMFVSLILDYTISETSLEQVFISFAKQSV